MLRWLYNLYTPPPEPEFAIGELVQSSYVHPPVPVVRRELQQVRSGWRWNEETRGWMYQLAYPYNAFWFEENILHKC